MEEDEIENGGTVRQTSDVMQPHIDASDKKKGSNKIVYVTVAVVILLLFGLLLAFQGLKVHSTISTVTVSPTKPSINTSSTIPVKSNTTPPINTLNYSNIPAYHEAASFIYSYDPEILADNNVSVGIISRNQSCGFLSASRVYYQNNQSYANWQENKSYNLSMLNNSKPLLFYISLRESISKLSIRGQNSGEFLGCYLLYGITPNSHTKFLNVTYNSKNFYGLIFSNISGSEINQFGIKYSGASPVLNVFGATTRITNNYSVFGYAIYYSNSTFNDTSVLSRLYNMSESFGAFRNSSSS